MPSTHHTHMLSYSWPPSLQSGTQLLECLLPLLMKSRGARQSFCKSYSLSGSQDLGQRQASSSKLQVGVGEMLLGLA